MPLPSVSRSSEETSAARRINRTMFAAGLLQIVSIYSPAARVRLYGLVPFHRVPNGGVALLTLGILTLVVALRPAGWWRWIPASLTAGVLAVVYWRVTHDPSRTFVDPLLRHLMHPSWGFIPMSVAVLINFVGATLVGSRRGAGRPPAGQAVCCASSITASTASDAS